MTTLTLELDSEELTRAEEGARSRGGDLRLELASRIQELASSQSPRVDAQEHMALLQEAFRRADAHPTYLEGGIPGREERNAR